MNNDRNPGSEAVSRRQARRDAMVILYQKDITGAAIEELFKNLETERGYAVAEYTQHLVNGVLSLKEELDKSVDEHSRNWQIDRMGALERNILRIAVFEIGERSDIAFETSVDEAVILAKRFCSREAASLVNGILGNFKDQEGAAGLSSTNNE